MRASLLLLGLLALWTSGACGQANSGSPFMFAARTSTGQPIGWSGGPISTLSADSVVFRSAPYAGRITRTTSSGGQFSTFTMKLPASFAGDTIELRGWLRLENVSGWAGLWLREDAAGRQTVAFDNMQQRGLSGTIGWTEFVIRLPLRSVAREIYLGALMTGTGSLWVDDVQLLVDGKSYIEAPPKKPAAEDADFGRGSGITVAELSPAQIENLALLGKVWGFVKYHHPRVTSGELNWDYDLFRVLPDVLTASNRAAATSAIDQWLAGIGDPDPCAPCARTPPVKSQSTPAIDWIRDAQSVGTQLSQRLQRIHINRHAAGPQYYVSQVETVGNPQFDNEIAYAFAPVPDAGYRILALYRFWNIIEYWFPYRDVMNENWDDVLLSFLPRFVAADDSAAYHIELMRLSARIHDTHSNTWGDLGLRPPRGDAEVPATLRFIDNKAVVTGYTHDVLGPATGLQRGDVIEAVSGQRVDSLIGAWKPLYSASNEPARLRDMANSLTRGDSGTVALTVLRGKQRLLINAQRIPREHLQAARTGRHDRPGEAFQRLADDVAYLKMSGAKVANVMDYVNGAADAKVFVIDLRNYPADFFVYALGAHLVASPTTFARFTRGDLANPGRFAMVDSVVLVPKAPRIEAKIVILVDEITQSSAEFHAMAFRSAPGAIIVGSTTAGADGNVSRIPFPGPSAGLMSGIGVFYPDGRPTQRIGIVPDFEVRPTIEGIRAGRDEVLEAAASRALGREFRVSLERQQQLLMQGDSRRSLAPRGPRSGGKDGALPPVISGHLRPAA